MWLVTFPVVKLPQLTNVSSRGIIRRPNEQRQCNEHCFSEVKPWHLRFCSATDLCYVTPAENLRDFVFHESHLFHHATTSTADNSIFRRVSDNILSARRETPFRLVLSNRHDRVVINRRSLTESTGFLAQWSHARVSFPFFSSTTSR